MILDGFKIVPKTYRETCKIRGTQCRRFCNYRANYRYRIAGWYNGWLHVFVIYVIGFTALSIYFSNVSGLRWWELAIVPVTFLFANFFEWWIHRFVMHRPSQVKAKASAGPAWHAARFRDTVPRWFRGTGPSSRGSTTPDGLGRRGAS